MAVIGVGLLIGGAVTEAFWGVSLNYHLVSLIALGFVLVGTIGVLVSLVDLAVPRCFPQGVATYGDEAGYVEGTIRSDCFEPAASVSLRQMLDFAIFLIVAGPVFWWHLRQGRRLVGRPQAA